MVARSSLLLLGYELVLNLKTAKALGLVVLLAQSGHR